jgi:hypothetical protein
MQTLEDAVTHEVESAQRPGDVCCCARGVSALCPNDICCDLGD